MPKEYSSFRTKDQFVLKGCLYVPFHSSLIRGGPFGPPQFDSVENHAAVPNEFPFHNKIWDQTRNGITVPRENLHSARMTGDSMRLSGVRDRAFILFQSSGFYIEGRGEMLVVERLGDEEGTGSWSLKRVFIRGRSTVIDETNLVTNWNDGTTLLQSCNPDFPPMALDPEGRYVVRGRFLRTIPREYFTTIDSEQIRAMAEELGKGYTEE